MIFPDKNFPHHFTSVQTWIFPAKHCLREAPTAFFQDNSIDFLSGIVVPTYAAVPVSTTLEAHARTGVFGINLMHGRDAAEFVHKLKTNEYIPNEHCLWTHIAEFLLPSDDPDICDDCTARSDTYWWSRKAEADDALFLEHDSCETRLLVLKPRKKRIRNKTRASKSQHYYNTKPKGELLSKKATKIYHKASRAILRDITNHPYTDEITWMRHSRDTIGHEAPVVVPKDPVHYITEPPYPNSSGTKIAFQGTPPHVTPAEQKVSTKCLTLQVHQPSSNPHADKETRGNDPTQNHESSINITADLAELGHPYDPKDQHLAGLLISLDMDRHDQQIQTIDIMKSQAIRIWGDTKSKENQKLQSLLKFDMCAEDAKNTISKYYASNEQLFEDTSPCTKPPANVQISDPEIWTTTTPAITEAEVNLATNMRTNETLSTNDVHLARAIREWGQAHYKSNKAQQILTRLGSSAQQAEELLRLHNQNPYYNSPAWSETAYYMSDEDSDSEPDDSDNNSPQKTRQTRPSPHKTQ